MPTELNLTMYRGDPYAHLFVFEDDEGNAEDVSGRTYAAKFRESPDNPDFVAFTIDDSDAAIGKIWIMLDEDTVQRMPQSGGWDMEEDDPASAPVTKSTIFKGKVIVEEDYTYD